MKRMFLEVLYGPVEEIYGRSRNLQKNLQEGSG
jgi:hypothetical protein